jgi:hypothetical protein
MQSVKALAKAVSKEMVESLKGEEELLTLALTKAQKDNNTVYLERVPPFAGPCMTPGLHLDLVLQQAELCCSTLATADQVAVAYYCSEVWLPGRETITSGPGAAEPLCLVRW